jgi:hypothetical protein
MNCALVQALPSTFGLPVLGPVHSGDSAVIVVLAASASRCAPESFGSTV